jgi:hypothetical protein
MAPRIHTHRTKNSAGEKRLDKMYLWAEKAHGLTKSADFRDLKSSLARAS